ncbi:hypothetical protein ACFX2I_045912 [Malus domestica]
MEDSFRLVNILTRLPAKSVVRFKCVSKRWCSILSDQQFAKSQFKFASSQHQRLLFQQHSSSSECLSFDLNPVSSLGDVSSVRKLTFPVERLQSDRARLLESHKKPRRDHVRLLASCNGLVCFTVDNPDDLIVSRYYIWNPTIGFLQKLPQTTSSSPSSEKKRCDLNHFGFGFVSATDEYKFLTSYYHRSNAEMEIFSSRTNSWKRISAADKGFGHSTDIINGVLFNEALHWPGYFNWKQQTIVVFYLTNKKFRVVPLPIKFQRSTGGAVSAIHTLHLFFFTLDQLQRLTAPDESYPDNCTIFWDPYDVGENRFWVGEFVNLKPIQRVTHTIFSHES